MTLLTFCLTLIVVNALTIGGGYVMIPLLQKEFVEKHHLLSNQEFLDAIAVGQVTPGPLTVMNAFIGYKVSGIIGAVLGMICTYLPSLVITTVVVGCYHRYREENVVHASFSGIKPAVIGLLAAVALSLGRSALTNHVSVGIAIASFTLIAFTKVDPSIVIIGAGIVGLFFL